MRIRAITLSDVRQFTKPVCIGGFDKGLNVLSAPNEAGKSTLFDALHAVFFAPHRSTAGQIKALRPLVGGNPAITLELEYEGATYRIEKVWGKGCKAEVYQGDRLIAKADDAEAWIACITTPAEDGGPAGLLWVRQGLVALDDGSRKELDAAHSARRDLLSSVTGEFESLTGGRRMDRALSCAQSDLDKLVTTKGSKAGGPYDAALKLRAALDTKRADQKSRSDALRDALARRRVVVAELNELADPAAAALRQKRLDDATEAQAAGQRHAEALEQASLRLKSATLHLEQALRGLDRFDAVHLAQGGATKAVDLAQAQAQAAESAFETASAAWTGAKAGVVAHRIALKTSEAGLQAALKAEAMRAAVLRRGDLEKRCADADVIEARLPALRAAARNGPDRKTADILDKAEQEVLLLERMRAAGAASFAIDHSGAARAEVSGAVLPDGQQMPILSPLTVTLPGLGVLRLTPGEGGADFGKIATVRQRFDGVLAATGLVSTADVRIALTAREAAEQALRDATVELRLIAPDGVAALREEVAALPVVSDLGDAMTIPQAESEVARNREAFDAVEAATEGLRVQEQAARDRNLRAGMAKDSADKGLAQATGDVAGLGAQTRQSLLQSAETLAASVQDFGQQHGKLALGAPDLAALAAAQTRARSVRESAVQQIASLREERGGLDAHIAIHAGNGVEEELADTETRLVGATAEVAALEREVAVLRSVIAALESAQTAARDRYFDPVMAELRPMLRLLWPDAELRFDAESLLPTHLIREGQAEEIGTLSGGTREQIALLVRLAFARLLAKAGRHAPVILDDALVYTDDDRIERMFDALHQQAADLQIIVLSCRNRVFRDLGGQKLSFRPLMDASIEAVS